MSFLGGIFGGDQPNKKNIDKLVARVKEAYAQPEYRREAMEKLLAWNTPESIAGVLNRFTVVVQSPHWDEEEKRWLVDELAELGAPARQALQRFLAKAEHIAFAAKALQRLGEKEQYLADLIAALKARAPDDHRTVQGKCELVACLADTEDPRVIESLLPYLDDHGDDVQCGVVDALGRLWPKAGEATAPALAQLQLAIGDDTRSARVLRHAAAAMNRLQLPIDATRSLAPAVAEDFVVRDGKLAPAH